MQNPCEKCIRGWKPDCIPTCVVNAEYTGYLKGRAERDTEAQAEIAKAKAEGAWMVVDKAFQLSDPITDETQKRPMRRLIGRLIAVLKREGIERPK